VWLPELFPTRVRGTAVALCSNAPFLPETNGKPLPENLAPAVAG
jgi:hypothetical protein